MSLKLLWPGLGTGSGAPSGGGGGGGGVAAVWSDLLAEVPGINVHTAYATQYMYRQQGPHYSSALAAMEAALSYMKIRHVRDILSLNSTVQRAAINAFWTDLGVDCLMTAGTIWPHGNPPVATTPPTASQVATDISTHYPNSVIAVEGLNESDNSGRSDWITYTKTYQASLATAIRGIGLPVMSPPLAATKHMATFGDVDANSDKCALHVYDGANPPGTSISSNSFSNAVSTSAVNVASTKDRWLTECGDHDAIHAVDGFPPLTEAVSGIYAPILFLEAFRQGIVRAYRYELCDDQADSAYTNIQRHFGTHAWNKTIGVGQSTPEWRAKPNATAIRNYQTLVADPGAPYSPANLDVTLTGDVNLRSIVMGKRDGSYMVAVWRNVSVWTPSTTTKDGGKAVTVAPETITATFGVSKTVDRFQPSTSAVSLQSGTGTTFAFPVAGEAVFLRVV